MPMNPEIKAKWLEALRSEKYKQTTGALCRPDNIGGKSYCCLGVLCEVALPDPKWEDFDGTFTLGDFDESAILPATVCQSIGLSKDEMHHFPPMNDGGQSFAEIADYIEQKL